MDALWRGFLERCKQDLVLVGKVRVKEGALLPSSVQPPGPGLAGDAREPLKSVSLSKARLRLDHLQSKSRILESARPPGDGSGLVSLTQKEYIDRVIKLRSLLRRVWKRGERTQALRIVIHAAKLLADSSDPRQHPFLWAHVVQLLDEFGKLVEERMQRLDARRAEADADAGVSLLSARESCGHWFAKAANIRELLPRLYVQIALLPCHRFCAEPHPDTSASSLELLGKMRKTLRGVGDPLVGLYCRAFFVRNGAVLVQSGGDAWREIVSATLFDYLQCSEDFRDRQGAHVWAFHGLSAAAYEPAHVPAVEWIIQIFGQDAKERHFDQILERCVVARGIGLRALLSGFAPAIFVPRAHELLDMLDASDWDEAARGGILARIANGVSDLESERSGSRDGNDDNALRVFARLYESVFGLKEISAFAPCAVALVRLAMAARPRSPQPAALASEVVQRLGQAFDEHGTLEAVEPALEQLCLLLCGDESAASNSALADDNVLMVLEMIQTGRKFPLERSLIDRLAPTSDPVVIHAALTIARDLHDGIDALSGEEERALLNALLCQFLDRIQLREDRDRDQAFQVLADCRASFPNLMGVQERIVWRVADLAVRAGSAADRAARPSDRETPFVKSCLAFCHITIPSLAEAERRFALSRYCAQVALGHGLLPQAEAHLGEALAVCEKVSDEERRLECVTCLLGDLVDAPSPPQDPLQFFRELLCVVAAPCWTPVSGRRALARIAALRALAELGQAHFARLQGEDVSEDALWSRDPAYARALGDLASEILHEVYHEDVHPRISDAERAPRRGADAQASSRRAWAHVAGELERVLTGAFVLDEAQGVALQEVVAALMS